MEKLQSRYRPVDDKVSQRRDGESSSERIHLHILKVFNVILKREEATEERKG
jgi:hypothetical protein